MSGRFFELRTRLILGESGLGGRQDQKQDHLQTDVSHSHLVR